MRLPLVPPIDSRDGTDEKDCLCKNLLIEVDDGIQLATLRPGLTLNTSFTAGAGNNIVEVNGVLIEAFGSKLYVGGVEIATIGSGMKDFAQAAI